MTDKPRYVQRMDLIQERPSTCYVCDEEKVVNYRDDVGEFLCDQCYREYGMDTEPPSFSPPSQKEQE